MLNDAVKTLDVAVKDLQTQTTDKYTAVQEKLSSMVLFYKQKPLVQILVYSL